MEGSSRGLAVVITEPTAVLGTPTTVLLPPGSSGKQDPTGPLNHRLKAILIFLLYSKTYS